MNKKIVIIGAGGHSKVLVDIIEKNNDIVFGFLDDNTTKIEFGDYKVLGKINSSEKISKENSDILFIIAIGNKEIRKKIAQEYNLKYYTAIHPTAVISGIDVTIEEGTAIMANAVINSSAKIGKNVIINTGSIIEHDTTIEDFVHISYGVIIGAKTKVEESSYIGAGSVIKINDIIPANSIISNGTIS